MRKFNQANMIGRKIVVVQGNGFVCGMVDVLRKSLRMLHLSAAHALYPAASLVAAPATGGTCRPDTGTGGIECIHSISRWSRGGRRRAIATQG